MTLRPALLVPVLALGATAAAADVEYGRYLASECVTCHLLEGEPQGVPSITGWETETFIAVLTEYRTRARVHDVMNTIAGRYGDEEIAALAAYFAEAGED